MQCYDVVKIMGGHFYNFLLDLIFTSDLGRGAARGYKLQHLTESCEGCWIKTLSQK